ncbi:hypothetical protein B566_EDAN008426 [Ephemera danica]|nr:hypothetical protein B566_EDAN008426 [Ephemera danica]
MIFIFYTLSLPLLFSLTTGEKAVDCPNTVGIYPFDDIKIQGKWYIVAGLPSAINAGKTCSVIEITSERNDTEILTSMHVTYNVNKVIQNVEIFSRSNNMASPAESYGVFNRGNGQWSEVYKHSIVAIDYDNYAISIACKPKFYEDTMTFGRSIYADIWSRRPTLDKTTLQTLKNVLSGYNIDIAQIKDMSQTTCN